MALKLWLYSTLNQRGAELSGYVHFFKENCLVLFRNRLDVSSLYFGSEPKCNALATPGDDYKRYLLHNSVLTGSKLPGPASKTGVAPLKNPTGSKSSSGKGQQSQGKGSSSGKGGDKGSHAVRSILVLYF